MRTRTGRKIEPLPTLADDLRLPREILPAFDGNPFVCYPLVPEHEILLDWYGGGEESELERFGELFRSVWFGAPRERGRLDSEMRSRLLHHWRQTPFATVPLMQRPLVVVTKTLPARAVDAVGWCGKLGCQLEYLVAAIRQMPLGAPHLNSNL